MTQGAIKKSSRPALGARAKKGQPKKATGRGVRSPERPSQPRPDKITKKFSSGMAAMTEAMLGERAGHLELIGKGKKGKKAETAKKGGSRKFG